MAATFDPYHRFLGIPPEEQPSNHYRLLGLKPFESDPDVIQSAADRQMIHLRTFQASKHGHLAEKLLNEVAAAKVCLLNAEKKSAYDLVLREWLKAAAKPPAARPPSPPPVAAPPKATWTPAREPAPAPRPKPASAHQPQAGPTSRKRILAILVGSAMAGLLLVLAVYLVLGSGPSVVTVQFDVPEAQRSGLLLKLDGNVVNVPSWGPIKYLCKPGEHQLTASRPGFETQTLAIRVGRRGQKPIPIRWEETKLALQWPEDQREGVSVEIDETPVEVPKQGPAEYPCQPGEHRIVISRPGFAKLEEKVSLEKGELKTLRVGWNEAKVVFDWPEELREQARLKIDGLPIEVPSQGPIEQRCRPGKHQIMVTRPGFDTIAPSVTVEKGQKALVKVNWPDAVLVLDWPESQRKNTTLEMDGQPQRVFYTGPVELPCRPGERRLVLSGFPGPPLTYTATLRAGERKKLKVGWEKAGDDEEGVLVLNWPENERQGATLHIDGKPVPLPAGNVVEHRLPAAFYRVVAARPGFKPFEQVVGIEPNGRKEFRPAWDPAGPPQGPKAAPKLAPPSQEVLAENIRRLTEAYKLSEESPAPQKLKHAEELWALVGKSQDKADERYALLYETTKLACDGGDVALMVRAIDRMTADFELPDPVGSKAKLLLSFPCDTKDSDKIQVFVKHVGEAVDQALLARRCDEASKLCQKAHDLCRTSKDPKVKDLRAQLENRSSDLRRLCEALGVLKDQPDDSAANLTLGRWYCLSREQWPEGLPHLARGSDAGLKKAAALELAAPKSAADQVALADAWWAEAEKRSEKNKEEEVEKDTLVHRAGYWYKLAQPQVSSAIDKTKLKERLDEVAKLDRRIKLAAPITIRLGRHAITLKSADQAVPRPPFEAFKDRPVEYLSFSPNGALLLTGSTRSGHELKLWDVAPTRFHSLLQWEGVPAPVFSPDSSLVATRNNRITVRLWSAATGIARHTLEGHTDDVWTFTFSPDGATLASAGRDGTVRLFDVATGRLRQALTGHTEGVTHLAFSPDGSVLASGSADDTVRIWNAASGELQCVLEGRAGDVRYLAFHPQVPVLASGIRSGRVQLWDFTTGKLRSALSGHLRSVAQVFFSPDGTFVIGYNSGDAAIDFWDLSGAEMARAFVDSPAPIQDACLSPDGSLIATACGNGDRAIHLWDTATGRLCRSLPHPDEIWRMAFRPDGSILATGGKDKKVYFWTLPIRGK